MLMTGYGTYSVTTIQGKGNRIVSFILVFIAVKKVSDIGIESLFAQQQTIYKWWYFRYSSKPSHFCPRKNAVKPLNVAIKDLQATCSDGINDRC